jgi:hypothetical protein
MENEERYIKEKIGDKSPFRVPEDYFDQLASRVMSQLPEQQELSKKSMQQPRRQARLVALRPWLYAAACVIAIVVLTLTLHFHQRVAEPLEQPMAAVSTPVDDEYIDDVADYVMLDNTEIYAYLAEN